MTRLFLPPSLRHFTPRRILPGPASRHVPLEYDLVEALRPRLVVDVGAGAAVSFFTYCQSMKDHDVDGIAYAIDTWDETASPSHPEAAFDAINAHGRKTYLGLHYLMRAEPSTAFGHFAEGSVDLLRVDAGRAALRAQEEFDAWFARLRPGGILALHGVTDDQGRELFRALGERGKTALFSDGSGLGLVRAPGGAACPAELLHHLFVEPEVPSLEALYLHAREHHQLRRLVARVGGAG